MTDNMTSGTEKKAPPWRTIGLAAAGAIAVAAFLPWVSVVAPFVGSVSINGIEGDGKIALGLAALVAVAFHRNRRPFALVASALAAGFAVWEAIHISGSLSEVAVEAEGLARASMGVGVWLLVAAATTATIAAVNLAPEIPEGPVGHSR